MEVHSQETSPQESENLGEEPLGPNVPTGSSRGETPRRFRNVTSRVASTSAGRVAFNKRKRGNSEDPAEANEAEEFQGTKFAEETFTQRGSSRSSSRTRGPRRGRGLGRGRGRASYGKRARGNGRTPGSLSIVETETSIQAPASKRASESRQISPPGLAIESVEQQNEMPDSGSYGKKGDKTSSGGSGGGKKDSSSKGGRKSRENSADTEVTTEEATKRGRSRSGYN